VQHGNDSTQLSKTIASTATIKLAHPPMLDLFYTPLEERFERITRIARQALQVPVAAITLVNGEKQWFKSAAGWAIAELPADLSLCRLTLEQNGLQVVSDTKSDARTANHPLVVSKPKFRFYAGHPLTDATGLVAGTFCVFDVKPRHLSDADRRCLLDLSALAQREVTDEHLRSAHASLTAKLGLARREAMIDPLTKLWNRRGALVLGEAAFQRADRANASVGLAVLDLDNFKHVNDTYGHQTGDDVLRRVSERLVAAVRAEDIVCRLGGDEFLVLVADGDPKTTDATVKRLRDVLVKTAIATRDGVIDMSASAGLTVRRPREEVTVEALIERADRKLIAAKADRRKPALAR
jgi:diguanylate cyclase (GGDEF)-like protein